MKIKINSLVLPLLIFSLLSTAFGATALIIDKPGSQGETGSTGQDGVDGSDGLTPFVGNNGHWWIGDTDTGIDVTGPQGEKGETGKTGSTGEDGVDGSDGLSPTIGGNGNWWIGEIDTGIRATPYSYTVTFNPNNGEASFTQEVLELKKLIKPVDPVKPGYVFHGWYADTNEMWVFAGYPVTENMTLNAQYSLDVFTVSLDTQGGSVTGATTLDFEYLSAYTLPNPVKSGSKFGGWQDGDGNILSSTGIFTYITDLNLVAVWNPLYTVTFDSDGGSQVAPIDKYDFDPIAVLPTSTKAGSVFKGWYLGETKIEAPYTPSGHESVTLVAKWDLESSGFLYRLIESNSKIEIFDYIGNDTTLTVPNTIGGLPVATIAADTFKNETTITSITAGTNLKTIGNNALNGCTSLVTLDAPGLTSLGSNALMGASALSSLSIGKLAFALLSAFDLTEANMPASLTNLKIHHDFTDQEASTFFSGITRTFNIVIGAQVTAISFYGTNLVKSLSFEPNSMLERLDNWDFRDCTKLESIVLPDHLNYIGTNTFNNATSLTSIVIPDTVKIIEYLAFYGCNNLTSVTLSRSLTTLGFSAFANCTSLSSIVIPLTVTSIGSSAFSGCTALTIYCEVDSIPFGWQPSFNGSCPVEWGYIS